MATYNIKVNSPDLRQHRQKNGSANSRTAPHQNQPQRNLTNRSFQTRHINRFEQIQLQELPAIRDIMGQLLEEL